MKHSRLTRRELNGKVIDAHSHAGVAIGTYGRAEYPYAQTIEGLYYQQLRGRVDINIVFPFTSELYFDIPRLVAGKHGKARSPISPVPYQVENTLLLREVFDYCPELSHRFLPFISVDPLRETAAQMRAIETLLKTYPVYGIKVNPIICQAPVLALLKQGRCFLDLARTHNWPFLFHTTSQPNEPLSFAGNALTVADANPDLRFCLAHALLFRKAWLDAAVERPHVWIDTAAFKISVDVCRSALRKKTARRRELIDADFKNPDDVFARLCADYGHRIIWGTDSPAYAYICRRKRNKTEWQNFHYKGNYEDEIRALRSRPPALRRRITNTNTLRFLLGPE